MALVPISRVAPHFLPTEAALTRNSVALFGENIGNGKKNRPDKETQYNLRSKLLFYFHQILPVGGEGRGAVVAADAVGVVPRTLGGESQ